jgi:hypothetical protein
MFQSKAARRMKAAEGVMRAHSARWMALHGVVACGIGLANEKDPSTVVIKIYVRRRDLPAIKRIPKKVDGIPIVIETSDTIRAIK